MKDVPGFINPFLDELKSVDSIVSEEESKSRAERIARLMEISKDYSGDDRIVSSKEIAENLQAGPPEQGMLTGWSKFDQTLDGFFPKQLITVSGPTKNGKTSWCIDMTSRLSAHNPVWFPFEEPAEELIRKFLDRKQEPPEFYTPRVIVQRYVSVDWIFQKTIEAIAKFNSKVVFIDHLDFIVPFKSTERHDLQIGQAMRDLKGLAKDLGVTVFLMAHLTKTKTDKQPDMDDIRGSASVAQESDAVILLWRQKKRERGQVTITNNSNVSIQANRRTGKTTNVQMVYDNGRFFEEGWSDEAGTW